jgi:hypothetical protein
MWISGLKRPVFIKERMIQSFDPTNREHVEWLKKVFGAETKNKTKVLGENPMRKPMPDFDMVQIYFGLAAKYTQAVFNKTAFIP